MIIIYPLIGQILAKAQEESLQYNYYLINLDNRDDFILMKEDGDEMVSITDEDEYVRVLNMFKNKLTSSPI